MRVLVLVLIAGCLEPQLVPCGDLSCPEGYECTASLRCAAPADVTACAGIADGEACTGASGAGLCFEGVCEPPSCGDGDVDPLEACDDGNRDSGDGCRGDCLKTEVCGDATLDDGEACDDGNTNGVDGCDACRVQRWTATTAVGSVQRATDAALDEPRGVAVDVHGNIYVVEPDTDRVRKIAPDGSISTIAGTGERGFAGDGGQAASAQLATPWDVAVDGLGNVYVAEATNRRIRKIRPDGLITTIAGGGTSGSTGDGGLATAASFQNVRSVAVDGLGNVYATDGNRVRRIRVDGVIEAFAGTGAQGFTGDGGLATSAALRAPNDLAVDAAGNVLIADRENYRIRRVDTAGIITTIAGNGTTSGGSLGGPATAVAIYPWGITVAQDGTVYFTGSSSVLAIGPDGIIRHVAGIGGFGFSGDGGPAATAVFNSPEGLAAAPDGSVIIADSDNHRVRRIDAAGTINTIAGIGAEGLVGDGGDATSAQYGYPRGIALDAGGALYIADTDFYRVRKVSTNGDVSTIAGIGEYGYTGDGGAARAATLSDLEDVAVDAAGNVYIADSGNSVVRRIDTNGTISAFAGTGIAGSSGDGGPAIAAQLKTPIGLAITPDGELLIVDRGDHRIRRVDTQGTIHTLAGNGVAAFTGDGGPAVSASLANPTKVAVHGTDVYVADFGNARIRRVDAQGTITTVAGGGTSLDESVPATDALLAVASVAVDAEGVLYVAENYRVREVVGGTITTVLAWGNGDGDGGPVTAANIDGVDDIECDAAGGIYVLDSIARRIRRISPAGTITTVAGFLNVEGVGQVGVARLATPVGLAVAGAQLLVASSVYGIVERVADGRVQQAIGRYAQWTPTGSLARFRTFEFGTVGGVAFDPGTGTIFFTETSANRLHAVSTIGPGLDPANPDTWTIAAYANADGTPGDADGTLATARFRAPSGLQFDPGSRTLYVVDRGNHAVRAIDVANGTVSTIVNRAHQLGFDGDGGPAVDALLYQPGAVARCPNGDVFIADTGNHRVRRIAASTGVITTVLGDGVRASSGEGAPARDFPVAAPAGLACDAENNLFVSSTTTVRALPANAAGIVDGDGPVVTIYGDGLPTEFPGSQTKCLTGVISRSESGHSAHIQVADACTGLLVDLARVAVP